VPRTCLAPEGRQCCDADFWTDEIAQLRISAEPYLRKKGLIGSSWTVASLRAAWVEQDEWVRRGSALEHTVVLPRADVSI